MAHKLCTESMFLGLLTFLRQLTLPHSFSNYWGELMPLNCTRKLLKPRCHLRRKARGMKASQSRIDLFMIFFPFSSLGTNRKIQTKQKMLV